MALTAEQKILRRKILLRNASGTEADAYFDAMLEGGEFCLSQLDIWSAIFKSDEVNNLRKQAQDLIDQANALELVKATRSIEKS
jgi:hypothetical protein